jgi:hypothetical protein
MQDVELASIPLLHLLKPGPHTEDFWINMFPKKLLTPLVRPSGPGGQLVVGWGIRINETLNWAVVLLWLVVTLVAISIVVIAYSAITSDNSSAFGLGAYLVALVAIYSSYHFMSWMDEEN